MCGQSPPGACRRLRGVAGRRVACLVFPARVRRQKRQSREQVPDTLCGPRRRNLHSGTKQPQKTLGWALGHSPEQDNQGNVTRL